MEIGPIHNAKLAIAFPLCYVFWYNPRCSSLSIQKVFMEDMMPNDFCTHLLLSWPLALVGKLLPVPTTPLREYFGRCFRRSRKEGKQTRVCQYHTLAFPTADP